MSDYRARVCEFAGIALWLERERGAIVGLGGLDCNECSLHLSLSEEFYEQSDG